MNALSRWLAYLVPIAAMAAGGGLLAYGITEEVPIGGLQGKVLMKENGKPLPGALVTLEPIYTGDDESPLRIRRADTNKDGTFSLKNLRAGDYLLTITGDAHEMSREPVKVVEGKRKETTFHLKPIDPYLDLYVSQHVFTPAESPSFQVKGFFEKGDVTFTSYKLDMNKVLAAGNLRQALSPLSYNRYGNQKPADPTTIGAKIETWTQQPQRDVEGVFVETIRGKQLEEGLYWIAAKGGGMSTGTWLMITKLSLVTKHSGKDAIAFVTDIETGQPVPGAQVATFNGAVQPIGSTGSDGSLRFQLESKTVFATSGKSHALVDLYIGNYQTDPVRIVTYTDRPIYRPGDTVEFKGIVRKLVGKDYVVPASSPVSVELRDEDDNVVGTTKLATNPMGTYAGRFTLSRELGPGYMTLVSKFGDYEVRRGVSVAAYRKPTYTISVTPEKPSYVRGDRVRMKVKAEYYFGGPVPDAKIEAYAYRSEFYDPSVFGEDFAGYWGGEGEGYGGEYVAESKNLKTDDNGEAWFEFETAPQKDDTAESDYVYSVNVSVADEAGKFFEGSGSVKVLRGDFLLGIDIKSWVVTPGTPFEVTVRAVSPEGKPIPNANVELESGIEFWNGKDMEFMKPERQSVTLDANGSAKVQLTAARAGSFAIKATARDNRGNAIGTRDYVWADGLVDANAFRPTKLEVTLDKDSYRTGETAKAVIQCGSPGGSALVTIEADKLYETRVVTLDKPSVTIDLGVRPEHAPNAFVSVVYVREKTFNQTTEDLVVDDPDRSLRVEITPDKTTYSPGDIATYTLKTSSEDGRPVSAEVSVGVVDESIYAIAEDNVDLLREFYPRRYNQVDTTYSFPDLYLDGDKAPTSIQVRRTFKDTAFWAPAVQTDPAGHATVSVQLPDNLTTWRATAYGITARTEVGKAVSKVVAKRDLMVRLESPAFLVGDDKQRVTAMITNQTGSDAKVNLELVAAGVAVEGELRQQVQVEANGTKSIPFMVSPQKSGEATLTAKAWIDGGATDGVEAKIPVLPHGRTVRERFAGASEGAGSVLVTKRNGADANVGQLTITVAPSLAPALVQALDDLIDFPYGCVEQTMSRFLPAVTVSQAMKSGGFPAPRRASEIPAIVRDGIVRLNRMQHSSGAWGWWEYDEGDPFMTAYVLDGLRRAKLAGYSVDEQRIERALEWAAKRVASPMPALQPATSKWEKEYYEGEQRREVLNRAYLAYALAVGGKSEAARKFFVGMGPRAGRQVQPLVAAYAALSAKAMGEDPSAALSALASQATVSGAIASWEEQFWGVETTARCFDALMQVAPQHPLVDKVARWLMERRKGRSWWSTRDTSFAMLGLSRYIAATKELGQVGQIQVKVEGTVVGTVDGGTSESKLTIPIGNLKTGENKVEFVGVGIKRIYWSAELLQVDVSDAIGAQPAEGLTVERRYFKLSTRRFEDGSIKFGAGKEPITEADAGDLIQVQITLKSDRPREYLLIEDPIPAAFHVTEREDVSSPDDWGWWWDKVQIFDEKVAVFARFLPAGERVITYTVRVETPGSCSALPTSVSSMYDPEAVASSSGAKIEVRSR